MAMTKMIYTINAGSEYSSTSSAESKQVASFEPPTATITMPSTMSRVAPKSRNVMRSPRHMRAK